MKDFKTISKLVKLISDDDDSGIKKIGISSDHFDVFCENYLGDSGCDSLIINGCFIYRVRW